MSPRKGPTILALILTLSLFGVWLLPRLPNTHAASFTLYGRVVAPAGWGSTATTVTSPGPAVVVSAGAPVTLQLASGDGAPHQWFADYNGNQIVDPGEPVSTTFSTSTLVTFSFTATTTPGNHTYWCSIHFGLMLGTFAVKPVVATGSRWGE